MAEEHPDGHRPDIDWLRVIAVLLLVPFHAAIAFNLDPTAVMLIVKQAEVPARVIFEHFLELWQMPLLFVLAGWSVWLSIAKRDQKEFLKERGSRLGIPLLFGIVVLIPIAVYMYQLEVQATPPTFWAVWIGFFTQIGDFTGYDGKWTPGHLWFILYLLIFTLMLYWVFYWYREKRLKKMAEQNETSSNNLMPLVIMIVPGVLSFPSFGMKNMFYYGTFFVLGYILGAHLNLQKIIDRIAPVALILGTILFIVEIPPMIS